MKSVQTQNYTSGEPAVDLQSEILPSISSQISHHFAALASGKSPQGPLGKMLINVKDSELKEGSEFVLSVIRSVKKWPGAEFFINAAALVERLDQFPDMGDLPESLARENVRLSTLSESSRFQARAYSILGKIQRHAAESDSDRIFEAISSYEKSIENYTKCEPDRFYSVEILDIGISLLMLYRVVDEREDALALCDHLEEVLMRHPSYVWHDHLSETIKKVRVSADFVSQQADSTVSETIPHNHTPVSEDELKSLADLVSSKDYEVAQATILQSINRIPKTQSGNWVPSDPNQYPIMAELIYDLGLVTMGKQEPDCAEEMFRGARCLLVDFVDEYPDLVIKIEKALYQSFLAQSKEQTEEARDLKQRLKNYKP